MQVTNHPDKSRSIVYEVGDRVILTSVADHNNWIAQKGEHATVLGREESKYPITTFLDVQTDSMKAGGWGVLHVAPWDLAPLEEPSTA